MSKLPNQCVATGRFSAGQQPKITLPTPSSLDVSWIVQTVFAHVWLAGNLPGGSQDFDVEIVDAGNGAGSPILIEFIGVPNQVYTNETVNTSLNYIGTPHQAISVQLSNNLAAQTNAILTVIASLI